MMINISSAVVRGEQGRHSSASKMIEGLFAVGIEQADAELAGLQGPDLISE